MQDSSLEEGLMPHELKDGVAARVRIVTVAGLAVNLFLSGGKLAAGIVWTSQALVADAVHSMSDLATDFVVLFGVKYWSAPPDKCHPYGHGRIETLITALIGLLLGAVGAGIGWNAIGTVRDEHVRGPGIAAFVVAVVSIVSKEWLYRWTLKEGERLGSAAMKANAWHHRSDALSSIPVAAAIAVSVFLPDLNFIDHLGALVVSVFILHAAWRIVKPTLEELSDSSADRGVQREVERIAKGLDGIESCHAIRTRRAGAGIFVDLHIMVDGGMSVKDGHEIARRLKVELLRCEIGIVDVVVHVEPSDTIR